MLYSIKLEKMLNHPNSMMKEGYGCLLIIRNGKEESGLLSNQNAIFKLHYGIIIITSHSKRENLYNSLCVSVSSRCQKRRKNDQGIKNHISQNGE